MKRVIIESPFAGRSKFWPLRKLQEYRNVLYARKCIKDSLKRGEAPIASHLLYTQRGILDDTLPEDRKLGIDAGLCWLNVADKHVFYMDKGMSIGMHMARLRAVELGMSVEYRRIW